MSAPPQTFRGAPKHAIAARSQVGPNAILQLDSAIATHCGAGVAEQIFTLAALARYRQNPPTELVPESDAARLFAATRSVLRTAEADFVLTLAGSLTADYISTNRIPPRARQILRRMPPWLGARVLLAAIRAHAWTFAGSGSVAIELGRRPSLMITDNPLSTPGCPWHVAVLQRLFRNTVTSAARITHYRLNSTDQFCIDILNCR